MIVKENEIQSIIKNANNCYNIISKKSENGMKYYTTSWKNIPRFDRDGNSLTPEEFKEKTVDKYGSIYFKQNYECAFLGSSETLLDPETLKNLEILDPILVKDQILKIYKQPEDRHKYILAVDPAKDGSDAFAIQVVDATTINLEQVASANIQVDYLRMPEYIYNYGRYYNTAMVIVENNEGAGQSIADILRNSYDYENLYYDKTRVRDSITVKYKKYPGFRTTKSTRNLILNNLKMFADADKFKIVDKDTVKELFTFIRINGKYQADSDCHDDSVMSLALIFAPFTEARNFVDVKKMIEHLDTEESQNDVEFDDLIEMGNFDDFTDESVDLGVYSSEEFM